MKRVIVHLRDERGKSSFFATDALDDADAEAERARIEEEHARAGSENRWIRVGGTSVQSKHIVVIQVEDPPQISAYFGDDDEPRITLNTKF